jgi:hypothetical protein
MTQTGEDEWFLDDDWTMGDGRDADTRLFSPWRQVAPSVLVMLGLLVVFVVALLAAVGVFGSDAGTGATVVPVVSLVARTAPATLHHAARRVSTPVPPTTTLTPGDTGTQVKALQRELAALGNPVGPIDGIYGPATSKAVAAFQHAHHLKTDGIVGQATLHALAP